MKITVSKKTFVLLGYVVLLCLSVFLENFSVSIQSVLLMAAGVIFGAVDGAAVVGMFLMIGAFGIPVFDGFSGGFAFLVGSRSGYRYISAFFAAAVSGIMAKEPGTEAKHKKLVMAAVAALAITEIPPILHSTRILHQSPIGFFESLEPRSLAITCIVKVIMTTAMAKICRPLVAKLCKSE